MTQAQILLDLADRIRRLGPDRRDPEHYHCEKSEIAAELRRLALPGACAIDTDRSAIGGDRHFRCNKPRLSGRCCAATFKRGAGCGGGGIDGERVGRKGHVADR